MAAAAESIFIVLAFGANLGDRGETIIAAQREIAAHPEVSGLVASPLRETIALTLDGPDPSAPRYINGIATARTTLAPHALLDMMQRVENEHGRTRDVRWGDRTLDIDLILFGDQAISDDRLVVPHPRAHERDFVLSPWAALDAAAELPDHGRVADLLAGIGDTTLPLSEAPDA